MAASVDFTKTGLPPNSVLILAQEKVNVSHTGDTNETVLYTYTLPGGLMGPNDCLEIVSLWSYTNSANNKSLRIRWGDLATSLYAANQTTSLTLEQYTRVCNDDSTAAQRMYPPSVSGGFGTTTSAVQTFSVDTGSDVLIRPTGQLASAGETITLENILIRLNKAP